MRRLLPITFILLTFCLQPVGGDIISDLVENPGAPTLFPGTFVKDAANDAQKQAEQMAQRGQPAWDSLRGVGSRLGYYLTHGGVVPNSESVTVGGTRLTRGREYYIDYAAGSLTFGINIPDTEMISVTYRFVPGNDQNRTAAAMPGLALDFGKSLKTELNASYILGDKTSANTFDTLVYGAGSEMKLTNDFTVDTVYYVSAPNEDKARSMPLANGQAAPEPPKTDHFALHSGSLNMGKLKFTGSLQDIGADFVGFAGLTSQKRLSGKQIGQLEKEKGLKRSQYGIEWTPSTGLGITSQLSSIGEGEAKISTRTFAVKTPKLSMNSTTRVIGDTFTRFDSLAEGDRNQMKKQKGLTRRDIQGSYAFAPKTSFSYDSMMATDFNTGATRQRMDFTSSKVTAFSTYQRVDSGFVRGNDLALPYGKALHGARGSRFNDYGATLNLVKGLTVTSYQSNLLGSDTDIRSRRTTNTLSYGWRNTSISAVHDDSMQSFPGGEANQASLRSYALQQRFTSGFTAGWALSAQRQITSLMGYATPSSMRSLDQLNFTTTPNKRAVLTAEYIQNVNEIEQVDGRTAYAFAWTPMRNTSLQLNSLDVRNTLKGSQTTNSGHFEWAMPQARKLTVDAFTQDILGQGVYTGQSARIEGPLSTRFSLVGGYGTVVYDPEIDANGNPVGAPNEVNSTSLAVVTNVGKAKVWTGLTQVQSANVLAQLNRTFRIETPLGKNALVFDYGGAIDAANTVAATHTYQFISDRDGAKRLHFDVMYKVKDYGADPSIPIRSYNIDYKFSAKLSAAMGYYRNREKPDGKVDAVWGRDFKLDWALKPNLALGVLYGYGKNGQKDVLRNAITLQGKVHGTDLLNASVTVDYLNQQVNQKCFTYQLTYDHQVNADRYLAISAVYIDREFDNGSSSNVETQGRFDYKILFW